jgi:hypothetical protein
VPLSLQIRPFKNFSISPSLRYTGVLYPREIEKYWIPDYFDPELNQVVPRVVIDTINGLSYGQAINPSISAGFSPQIFGMYTFTNPNSRVQAVRHVIKPSFSFSFIPSIKGLSTLMYKEVQSDTLGNVTTYSIYENSIFGTPSLSQRSGNISISLTNLLEAKVFEKNDTTGKAKKVKIIENLGFSTSYNIFADSLNWSPVSMTFRTMLFDQVGISANSSFSLYGTDAEGRVIREFAFKANNKLMRMQNFSASVDFDLGELLGAGKGKKSGSSETEAAGMDDRGMDIAGAKVQTTDPAGPQSILSTPGTFEFDEYGYAIYDRPWTLAVAYNFSYNKSLLKSNISQQITLNGTLRIASKTSINYVTGFDIAQKEITMTRIGINRDLHCWDMSFNWIPTGYLKSWDFTIRIKSSMLSDLKYERRKDYRENF